MLYSRRTIQAMLNEVRPALDRPKSIIGRLNSTKADQVIPAIAELSILWALSKFGPISHDPELPNGRRPEALTENFIPGYSTYVEVKSVSDGDLGDGRAMRRAAQAIGEYANSVKRRAAKHIQLYVADETSYGRGGPHRKRSISPVFALGDAAKTAIRKWILSVPKAGSRLSIKDGCNGMILTWKERAGKELEYWSSMPIEIYKIGNNPIFNALLGAADQLSTAPEDSLKCIFLFDGGSSALFSRSRTSLQQSTVGAYKSVSGGPFTGFQIVRHFVDKYPGIIILTLSARRWSIRADPQWECEVHCSPDLAPLVLSRTNDLLAFLPAPACDAHRARALVEHGMFAPNKHRSKRIVGSIMSIDSSNIVLKIPSRALWGLLVGDISHAEFKGQVGESIADWLSKALKEGRALKDISIESLSPATDEDYVVVKLARDPMYAKFEEN